MSREAILMRSIDFYFSLLQSLVTGYQNPDINIKTLHIAIERSWWFIFDPKDKNGQFSLSQICKRGYKKFPLLNAPCNHHLAKKKDCTHPEIGSSLDEFKELTSFLLEANTL